MTKNVQSSVIHKSKQLEITPISIYRRMDILCYIHIIEYYTSGEINEL